MTTLISRAYAGPQDLTAILALMVSVRPADRIAVYPGIIDLHELLALPEVQANTRLWLAADGAVVAFAIVDHFSNLLFEHTPNAAGLDLELQLVAWGEACIRRTFQDGVVSGTWTPVAAVRTPSASPGWKGTVSSRRKSVPCA